MATAPLCRRRRSRRDQSINVAIPCTPTVPPTTCKSIPSLRPTPRRSKTAGWRMSPLLSRIPWMLCPRPAAHPMAPGPIHTLSASPSASPWDPRLCPHTVHPFEVSFPLTCSTPTYPHFHDHHLQMRASSHHVGSPRPCTKLLPFLAEMYQQAKRYPEGRTASGLMPSRFGADCKGSMSVAPGVYRLPKWMAGSHPR